MPISSFLQWLEGAMYDYGMRTIGSGYRYKYAHLARDLGIQRGTVTHWIKTNATPDKETISKLAVHFGTTSVEIYKTIGQPAPDGTESLAITEQMLSTFNKLNPSQKKKVLREIQAEYKNEGK